MGNLGFYFDQRHCSGCRTCQIACKDVNDLDVGVLFRKVTTYECGSFPHPSLVHSSLACNHCANPACVANCPTGAMYKDDESGLVLHDAALCIGCQTCVQSCPYGAPAFVESKGIVQKCDTCRKLRVNGEEPACVASCVMRCLHFGDLDELKKTYGEEGTVNELPYLPAPDTDPSLVIMPRSMPGSEYNPKML